MSNLYRIAPYSEDLAAAHTEFASRLWPTKRRRREEVFQRWKFRGPAQGEVANLLLAVGDEGVIGQVGLIPADLSLGGVVQPAQWVCDLMVDTQHRGQLVSVSLLKRAMANGRVTLGSNPSPAADVVMARLGFQTLVGPRIMVLPLRVAFVLSWKVPARYRSIIGPLGALLGPVAAVRRRRVTAARTRVASEPCTWRDLVPLICRREQAIEAPHIVHSEDFLAWRCPGLQGYNREVVAFQTPAGGYAIAEPTTGTCALLDWYAPDRDNMLALFKSVVALARDNRSQAITALAQSPGDVQSLQQAGFIAMRHPVKVICHPARLFVPPNDRFHYCRYDADGNL